MINPLKAYKAIVLYKNNRTDYAEIHNIKNGIFQNSRPVTIEELSVFAKMADKQSTITDKVCYPYRNIIGFESSHIEEHVVWICPAAKRFIEYSNDVKGLKSAEYHLPNLVFKSNGKNISVFAIKRKDILNLSPETKLYHAPLFNIFNSGEVCMGNVKIKKYESITKMINAVESAFFKSKFTHSNHNSLTKNGIINAYKNQNKKFDEKLLIESIKLKQLCK